MDVDYKGQARRLASFLSEKHKITLPPGAQFEAIAAINGFRDWDTLSGVKPTSKNSAKPPSIVASYMAEKDQTTVLPGDQSTAGATHDASPPYVVIKENRLLEPHENVWMHKHRFWTVLDDEEKARQMFFQGLVKHAFHGKEVLWIDSCRNPQCESGLLSASSSTQILGGTDGYGFDFLEGGSDDVAWRLLQVMPAEMFDPPSFAMRQTHWALSALITAFKESGEPLCLSRVVEMIGSSRMAERIYNLLPANSSSKVLLGKALLLIAPDSLLGSASTPKLTFPINFFPFLGHFAADPFIKSLDENPQKIGFSRRTHSQIYAGMDFDERGKNLLHDSSLARMLQMWFQVSTDDDIEKSNMLVITGATSKMIVTNPTLPGYLMDENRGFALHVKSEADIQVNDRKLSEMLEHCRH